MRFTSKRLRGFWSISLNLHPQPFIACPIEPVREMDGLQQCLIVRNHDQRPRILDKQGLQCLLLKRGAITWGRDV